MNRKLLMLAALFIAILLAIGWWEAVNAEPEAFTITMQSGGRAKYMWWETNRRYLGEVRFTACVGETLRVEIWLDTGYGWQKWYTYLITTNAVDESDDTPRLSRSSYCTLQVQNGSYFKKALLRSELFMPLFLDKSEIQPAYPYP